MLLVWARQFATLFTRHCAKVLHCPWPDQQAIISAVRIALVNATARQKPEPWFRLGEKHPQAANYHQNAGQYPITFHHCLRALTAIISRLANGGLSTIEENL
jgi:hypothetical protein